MEQLCNHKQKEAIEGDFLFVYWNDNHNVKEIEKQFKLIFFSGVFVVHLEKRSQNKTLQKKKGVFAREKIIFGGTLFREFLFRLIKKKLNKKMAFTWSVSTH